MTFSIFSDANTKTRLRDAYAHDKICPSVKIKRQLRFSTKHLEEKVLLNPARV